MIPVVNFHDQLLLSVEWDDATQQLLLTMHVACMHNTTHKMDH